MKAKKWLTIITLIITALSLVLAFIIGKNSNCITYDISMAIFGGAALGFIMSSALDIVCDGLPKRLNVFLLAPWFLCKG